MTLEEAIEAALDGEAVLFIGAGFSPGARNLDNEDVKNGRGLAKYLSGKSGLPLDSTLDDASDELLTKFGKDVLIKLLHTEYKVKEVAKYHREIATVPWKRVYTTNYDHVLKRLAHLKAKQSFRLL